MTLIALIDEIVRNRESKLVIERQNLLHPAGKD